MRPAPTITSATTDLPVTLAEAKLNMRVLTNDDDAKITRAIHAARDECEHILQRAIGQQTLMLRLDRFPAGGAIELPRPPIVSVESVQYVSAAGALTTIDGANYAIDDGQLVPWLVPAFGYTWPATREVANAVRISYVVGWPPADVPASVKEWILLRVGTLYEVREGASERPAIPQDWVDGMLSRYRIDGV